MWMKKSRSEADPRRQYDREMFRSSVVSLFWNLLAYRKAENGFTQQELADRVGVNKSAPSRWFSGEKPNWEANTMVDIADALGVELEIYARDRKTGERFAPYGRIRETLVVPTSSANTIPTNLIGTAPKTRGTFSGGKPILLRPAA
jgi:transcriptional regulator with XRE-family HTH domain